MKRDTFLLFIPSLGSSFSSWFWDSPCFSCTQCVWGFRWSAPWLTRPVEGGRTLVGQMRYMLPLLPFTALLNPLFNHQGVTVLFQLLQRLFHHPGG